ncbi:cystathionine gamma-synthase [Anaerococcus prevotii]|uniref:Aluminium resistance family protein n=1 Tax=Anaerococcus prevotii (strain ATCC 9321 / DSM 20548 / JCM 6508 / NCTC 11806 / PC1) TaxID=525919 RepID=C7RHL8_ANAPD|nr:aminotransferase class I/II-fold pyridoxal phosphate-dependent enzyme [Anaerococcus prevotii]ACV28979.1 Aluminium resistance family protein [Anaerococcus prevotii DSM 20548]SUU94652.1 cystathionine gamma-synthase [Anaerococcus prevotii]
MNYKEIYDNFKIDNNFDKEIKEIEKQLQDEFSRIDEISEYNQLKVLKAFKRNDLQTSDFMQSTGYGYADTGRDKIEAIFSDIFKAEDSLVRPSMVSGTHALSIVLFALLKAGDKMVAITDDPYDTMQQVIGIAGNKKGNLIERGIKYDKLDLDSANRIQYDKIKSHVDSHTKLVLIQRSTGYTQRRAFTIEEIKKAIEYIRKANPNAIIFVDNCYGEFTETSEPIEVGADILAGSLIKNLGGGIAITGGYICGKKDLVEYCANHLTAPGIGKDEGLSFGTNRLVAEGLYFAPHIVKEAIKVALLFAHAFNNLSYEVIPKIDDPRSDIVQSIILEDAEKVKVFCKAIQEACSVDSNFVPEAFPMPGYEDPVIMAAGGFVEGATSELSADGPLREPYVVYLQGGLNYFHGKLALKLVLDRFKKENFI